MPPQGDPTWFTEIASQDVEDIATEGGGWSGRILQVSAGLLGYRSRRLALGGIEIRRHRCDQALFAQWYNHLGAISIAWGDADGPVAAYGGRPLGPDVLYFQHAGREHDLRTPGSFRCWEIDVSATVRADRGWALTPATLTTLTPARRRALDDLCERAFGAVVAREHGEMVRHALRDSVLDEVERVLPELLRAGNKPTLVADKRRDLVREALDIMERASSEDDLVRVPSVAQQLGISERALYLAFQEQLGAGPYAVHQLGQLHRFREALAATDGRRGAITRAASRTGQYDASRLARQYRRQFGESPRQTLVRWSGRMPRRFGEFHSAREQVS